MRSRTWIALLAAGGLLAVLVWLLASGPGGSRTVLGPPESGGTVLGSDGGPEPVDEREEVRPEGTSATPGGLGPGDALAVADAVPDGGVVVRVRLVGPDGAPFFEPDRTVELLTWDAVTGAEELRSEPLQSQGWAEFAFAGPVWVVRALYRPAAAGLSFGYLEPLEDLEAGSFYEMVLGVGPAASIVGRVEGEDGRPLANVRVGVYGDGHPPEISPLWPTPVVEVTTDARGAFRFPLLPARDWLVCVPAGDWIQLTPDVDEYLGGRSSFDLRPGDIVDAGVFRVTRSDRFTVHVVDAAGEPVERAVVVLRLLEAESPAIVVPDPDREDWERWLDGGLSSGEFAVDSGSSRSMWSLDPFQARTSVEGSASFLVIPGTWRLEARLPLTCSEEAGTLYEDLRLPAGERRVVLPVRSRSWSGRVRSVSGEPINRASVWLERSVQGCHVASLDHTDRDGRFSFEGFPADGRFRVRISTSGYLPVRRELGTDPFQVPGEFELWPAAPLKLRFVDEGGAPASGVCCRFVDATPPASVDPEVWAEFWRRWKGRLVCADEAGRLVVGGLHPTTYEVQVTARSAPPGTGDELGRFALRPGPDPQTVRLPLPAGGGEGDVPTPAVRHLVRVLDARTEEPVVDAFVELRSASDGADGYTDEKGTVERDLPGGEIEVTALAPGYLPAVHRGVRGSGDPIEHEIRLEPFEQRLRIDFLASDGELLPAVDVAFRDSAGRSVTVYFPAEEDWDSEWSWDSGRVTVSGLAPGPLDLEVSLFGIPLGTYSVTVPAEEGAHTLTVRLPQSTGELRDLVREAYGEDDEDG